MAETAQDKTLALMRMRGPVLPVDVGKATGLDPMLAGAVLSELREAGKIRVSSVKVGGSPLYYLAGQEVQLEKYKDKLNEKDQRTFDLLKEQKVMRDRHQTPLIRVSLRQIKDFAKPLSVRTKEGEELFWKWHTFSNEESSELIKKELGIESAKAEPARVEEKKPEPQPEKKEIPAQKETPKQEEQKQKKNVQDSQKKLSEQEKQLKHQPKKRSRKSLYQNFMNS